MKRLLFYTLTLVAVAVTPSCNQNGRAKLNDEAERFWSEESNWFRNNSHEMPADIFYIVSTNVDASYNVAGQEVYNAVLDSAERALFTREMAYACTALFGDSLNFYSPYYHQFTMNCISLDSAGFKTAYDKAKSDVFDAFDNYMTHHNNGRPFIIAGFSQGAMLTVELLKHIDDEEFSRLLAAYVIGYGIDKDDVAHPHVIPAEGPYTPHACISFNTVSDTSAIWKTVYNNSVACINPISWTTDNAPVSFNFEGQSISVSVDTLKHILVASGYTDPNPNRIWPNGCLHGKDILFYTNCIRKNALERAKTGNYKRLKNLKTLKK